MQSTLISDVFPDLRASAEVNLAGAVENVFVLCVGRHLRFDVLSYCVISPFPEFFAKTYLLPIMIYKISHLDKKKSPPPTLLELCLAPTRFCGEQAKRVSAIGGSGAELSRARPVFRTS